MNELYTTEQSYHRLLTLIQTVSIVIVCSICVAALAGAWGWVGDQRDLPSPSSTCHIDMHLQNTYIISIVANTLRLAYFRGTCSQ